MGFLDSLSKIASPIGTVIGLGNSILGASSARSQNERMMAFQRQMADLQYARQRTLTHDLPSLQKQGLMDAGMSPSALGGYSGAAASIASVPSTPSQLPEYKGFDPQQVLTSLLLPSQLKQAQADADLAKSNADLAALKVNEEQDKQNAFREASSRVRFIDPYTGVSHYNYEPDFDQWKQDYISKHGSLPEPDILPGRLSQAAVDASKVFSDLSTSIARNNSDSLTSKFSQILTDLKLKDRNVMSALYQMDSKQFELLGKQIEKIGSDIDVNKTIKDLNAAKTDEARQSILESVARASLLGTTQQLTEAQIKQMKNSNIGAIFDSVLNGKSFGDKLAALGKLIVTALFGSNGGQLGAIGSLLK